MKTKQLKQALRVIHSKCSTLLDLEVQVFHFYVGFVCLLLLNVRASVYWHAALSKRSALPLKSKKFFEDLCQLVALQCICNTISLLYWLGLHAGILGDHHFFYTPTAATGHDAPAHRKCFPPIPLGLHRCSVHLGAWHLPIKILRQQSHPQNPPWRNEDLANNYVKKRKKLCLATGPSQKRHPHLNLKC